MAKKDKDKEKDTSVLRDYAGEAALRLVNLLFDTDEEHMLSLTRLHSSREALLLSIQIAKEAALKPGRNEPLSRVWRRAYLLLVRSIDMKAFLLGVGLAQEQASEEEGKPYEEGEL